MNNSKKNEQMQTEQLHTELNIDHWLFIRGLGRHKIHWGEFVNEFKTQIYSNTSAQTSGQTSGKTSGEISGKNCQIHQLDLAGNGDQSFRQSFLHMRDNVEDLRQRLPLNADGSRIKLNLLTISLGSMVGVEWARLYPEEISCLFTINTSDAGSSAFYQRLQPQNLIKIFNLLKTNNNQQREKIVLDATVNLLNQDEKTHWSQIFAKHPVSKMELLRQLFCASQYKMPKIKPQTKIHIINCENDRLVNASCSLKISQMWNLPIHTHPKAGHDLPLDDKLWLCTKIKELL